MTIPLFFQVFHALLCPPGHGGYYEWNRFVRELLPHLRQVKAGLFIKRPLLSLVTSTFSLLISPFKVVLILIFSRQVFLQLKHEACFYSFPFLVKAFWVPWNVFSKWQDRFLLQGFLANQPMHRMSFFERSSNDFGQSRSSFQDTLRISRWQCSSRRYFYQQNQRRVHYLSKPVRQT